MLLETVHVVDLREDLTSVLFNAFFVCGHECWQTLRRSSLPLRLFGQCIAPSAVGFGIGL